MQKDESMSIKHFGCALLLAFLATVVQAQETVVTVNGNAISKSYFSAYGEAMNRQGRSGPDTQMLEQLIIQELLVQAALDAKLDQQDDIITAIQLQRRNLLAGSALQAYLAANEPDAEALQKLYDDSATNQALKEYKARHILLASEADAQAVVTALDGGADFAELANEKSTGPSGPQGGDLGWFSPDTMVPPFATAVASMNKGSYTKTPVQTQFGWHVILLENERELEPDTFESMEANLKEQARRQLLNDYVSGLRENAEVVMP
jgi:peptidyl-prolyl cis-trans isomerase C